MRWQKRDVQIAEKCTGATFSIMRDDWAEYFEGLDAFKYLWQVLNWTHGDWPAVLRDIRKSRQVWGRLGKLLRQESAYRITTEKFYRVVVQAVLLFGAKKWVMSAAMLNNIEGVHVDFL